ncbi:amidohydrolase [Pseudodesulfovibrio sp. zrk46]|uniref:amidohydrolase n=1 Tax=Pseudodesulfovibrio sp. zrk46 TaxID=2725288 RepID=UPI001449A0F5|nr:amidohydrolase [Pseudodesulfovibrio sp. zrk46]QJB56693.1 amidohydrolase [Pseudodesulfovibrio sp. zrk46]
MHERFVLINANGMTMDANDTRFEALAVENGRITTVGTYDDVAPLIEDGWNVHDMVGKTVLPGFIDTHQHLGLTGQVLNGLDLRNTTSIQDILTMVKRAAPTTPEGAWVLGYSMNELHLAEGRLPLKTDLDEVCPDHPAMLVHASWHLCALNSRALELMNLPSDLPGMDIENGEPTGVVRDPGALSHVFPAVSALTPVDVKIASFKAACEAALRQGITSLHCLEGGEFGPGDTRIAVEHQHELPIHTLIWNQVMDINETISLGLPRIGGCICADGAMSAHTAALLEPYTDQPDNCGTLNFSQQTMDDFIMESHKSGLQVAIHCETDGAIEQVLSAMEKAIAAHPRDDHRHRIEHCEMPNQDQVKRMGSAGIIASMQPAFFPHLMNWDDYESWFGKERMSMLHPYRTMLNCGVKMCGGSDGPITPYSPLVGIQSAVLHPNAKQRLSVTEAIRLFTIDAAYSGFEEDMRGSIEPGKVADMVVLPKNPTEIAPNEIADLTIEAVYVEGEARIL